ncbi:MAG: phosphate acetyltransferase [Candidatus Brocadia sp.]|uniref:Phosphate acetyltransferase n=1 Tax=Candidatus Brocadia fulgida TaxID=380242 RepID=A0A0M2UW84_9BACT|nr:MAG: putative phosphotransacetylase protein [Candidatus Brocadia fulgida]MCC6326321.1 phosphate acetyltransferase [Candidatus Brocadia sp.]MDG5995359.1 phosphate acetyltransferase [Candidatus Brocadia sp.]RIJ98565.1 MAG: phosphate acetyltransferase [Candidatus Brocadia sp.]UJS19615.1 MAG: phosphate acetyltransferase [Candidatus Brocadia sp.]
MSQGIYITSAEPRSGKSVIVLGIMEILSGRMGKIGFFRPVVRDDKNPDHITTLITRRYALDIPYEKVYGCSYEAAREMLVRNRDDDLLKLILEKYRALQAEFDLVVCVGSDFTGPATALEFDFNAKVANNLGCSVLPVVKGYDRDTVQIVSVAQGLLASIKERSCDVLSLIVNRVPAPLCDSVHDELRRAIPADIPTYVLPEIQLLEKPTVDEIAVVLSAERLSGHDERFNHEVRNFKIAAMELPHFLEHIEEGSLIITPGDRSDVVLASLLADASNTYPHISGIILTGGIRLASQVWRLIEGLRQLSVPMIAVSTDTYTTALNVSSLEGVLSYNNPRKIAAALGIIEAKVNVAELFDRISAARSERVTPLMFEYEIIRQAKSDRKHIVLPEGTEERVLRAAEILRMRDVVAITLLGDEREIWQKAADLGISLPGVSVIDPVKSVRRQTYADAYFGLRKHKGISPQMAFDTMSDISYFGTMMVYFGEADGMVSGSVHTTQHTIRPAFEVIKTRPGCSIVSSVFFMCLADRVLVFGDCAVNPDPNPGQLADIAISSAETALMFGVQPFIAMLSYSTGESGKGTEVDKVREATRIAKERRPDLKIEGPMQYDAAVDAGVAKTKLPGSAVAGHATVFIFPDLNTGNNTYKAVQRSAHAVAVGPVLQGLNKPVNDLSRGCTVTDIVNTVAITAIQSQRGGTTA